MRQKSTAPHAGKIMTKKVTTLSPETTLLEASKLLVKKHCLCAPVVPPVSAQPARSVAHTRATNVSSPSDANWFGPAASCKPQPPAQPPASLTPPTATAPPTPPLTSR